MGLGRPSIRSHTCDYKGQYACRVSNSPCKLPARIPLGRVPDSEASTAPWQKQASVDFEITATSFAERGSVGVQRLPSLVVA